MVIRPCTTADPRMGGDAHRAVAGRGRLLLDNRESHAFHGVIGFEEIEREVASSPATILRFTISRLATA